MKNNNLRAVSNLRVSSDKHRRKEVHHRQQTPISSKVIPNRKHHSKSPQASDGLCSHTNSSGKPSSRLSRALLNEKYKEKFEKTRIQTLHTSNHGFKAIPSGYKHPRKYKSIQSRLLHEAKMFQDSDFEFLWDMQQALQPFLETVAGRISSLRCLRTQLN